MSKHTPGPWHVEEAIGDAETGETLWYTIEDENDNSIAGFCSVDHADLIAAAPEMMEALERAYRSMKWFGWSERSQVLECVEKAIAKAKGETE